MLVYSLTIKNDGKAIIPQKEDIVVHLECPGTAPRLNVMISGGSYNIGFTPSTGGQHWFDFVWRGTWLSEPFMLPIKNKENEVPDYPYTGVERKKAGSTTPTKSTASKSNLGSTKSETKEPSVAHSHSSNLTTELPDGGANFKLEDLTISFYATDKYGTPKTRGGDLDKFKVEATGGGNIKVIDKNDGRYTFDYHVIKGVNIIKVLHNGIIISGFPIKFEV